MNAARDWFEKQWQALPDHEVAPEGKFFMGDICKVNGLAYVWTANGWKNAAEEHDKLHLVETMKVNWP